MSVAFVALLWIGLTALGITALVAIATGGRERKGAALPRKHTRRAVPGSLLRRLAAGPS